MMTRALSLALVALAMTACVEQPTVLLRMQGTPPEAHVYLDDRFVGRLEQIQKRGIKMPLGEHRLTVEEVGYFPHDQLLELNSQDEPVTVKVELTRVPD
jgi:hypothetical protein